MEARRNIAVWCSAGISMNLPAAICSGDCSEFCHETYSAMPDRAWHAHRAAAPHT